MKITGGISVYDLIMAVGLILTAIRMAVQYHVMKRVQVALHAAETDVEKLRSGHQTHTLQIVQLQQMHDGVEESHPPEPSPDESPSHQ